MPVSRALLNGWPLVAGRPSAPVTPTLNPLTLSAASFAAGAASGALIGTISGLTAGSTVTFAPNDGRVVVGSGALVVGLTASTAGKIAGRLTETHPNAANSPRVTDIEITVNPASLVDMTGAAARVAITDASYWIRSGGTLARSTDTTYEAALKASSVNKTIPIAGSQPIPAGSIGYVMLRLPATTDASPPLFVNWDGNSAIPSAASPLLPTVFERTDNLPATGTGTPDEGTFVQVTDFTPFRPTAATDAGYGGRGQRLFHGVKPERILYVKFDMSQAGPAWQAVVPHIACSSGEWAAIFGMSIIRNQYSSISTVNASRAAVIAAVPGSDPFFFVSARSGANQQAIIDEQVTPFLANASLRKFVRAIYVNPWINDLAFSSVRPYGGATQAVRDAIGQRSTTILSGLKSLGLTLVVSDCTYGNYGAATPAVGGDVSSANGNLPYITNVMGPVHKAQVPTSFDPAYDWPYVSQYASMANTFETAMADEVHPNGTGYTPQFKTAEYPNWRMIYGQAPGANTMQSIITGLGSSTTVAKKTRAQAVFGALVAAYPTADSTANGNRTTLRAQLDAIAAA